MPGVLEHGVEQAGELAVAVPDQEPRPAAGILKVHDEVLRGLGDPGGSGMRGCAQDPDPPAGVLDDRQHVQAGAAQGDGLEEVAGKQRIGLGAEEAGPGGGGALGCRVDPGLLKDLPHGGGGDLDPEDEQFAVDAPVAPARDSPVPGAAPAGGWSGRCAAGPGAWGGTWPRGGVPAGRGASAAPCPAAPAAGTGQARPVGAGAAGRPGTPGRQGRTAAGSCPAAAPAPRSGGAAPGSPRPCPGRSPEAAAVTRTRSSHPDRPVEAAQPIIMPQRAGPSESNQLIRPRRDPQ